MEAAESCSQRLKKLLVRLRDDCELLAIILKSGSKCCRQKGCICQVNSKTVTLITDDGNCSRIYIPLDCICAVEVICDKEDKDDKEGSRDDNKSCGGDDESEAGDGKDDECEDDWEDNYDEEWEEDKVIDKVYGYGRKIRINFLNQGSEMEIEEVSAVELSLNVSNQNNKNLVHYFHRNQTDSRNLGVSVLPTGPGEITGVEVDETETEAVISGSGLLYINSQPETEVEFELIVTDNQVSIEFGYQDEQLVFGPNELIGVGSQQPITIQRSK